MRAEGRAHPLRIGAGCTFHGEVTLGDNTIIGHSVVVGYPSESRLEDFQRGLDCTLPNSESPFDAVAPTGIGHNCRIGSHVVLYEGTQVGDRVLIDDRCRIGFDCIIGDNTRVVYAAWVCDHVRIGSNCVVAGFVCDRAVIGDNAKAMGTLVHEFTRPQVPWGLTEPSPQIEERVVVGFDAKIVGGITVGHNSYVAAGAVVTKDVPPKSVVIGVNQIIPWDKWSGAKLSRDFWNWGEGD